MSIHLARRKRSALFFSLAALMLIVAALSAISARDPDGVTVRIGMTLVTLGAAMWLPWQALLPAVVAVWLGPNIGRNLVEDYQLFNLNMMLELPGLLALAAISSVARTSLRELEQENILLGMSSDSIGTDPVTGVFEESGLRNSLQVELSRSRRFGRTFAFVLVGIDEMRQRFDYRDQAVWQASFAATADLLRGTRTNVDRIYRFGSAGFALILPESGPKDIDGLVRRLRRVARKAKPAEGEPGGPLPAHYGATFFPTCATTVDDLVRRAEIALRIADNKANRVQLDGAEAPEMLPVEAMRQSEPDASASEPVFQPSPEPALTTGAALRITEPEAPAFIPEEPESGGENVVALPDLEPVTAPEAPVALIAAEALALPPILEVVEAREDKDGAPPEVIEAIKEAQVEVFAFRAPEPAVDVYNRGWQAEAPLSVIRRPEPEPREIGIDDEPAAPELAVHDILSEALKQLDGTLELIRSMKRSA